ncbi:hypothetical protein SERLA73DRAFT_189519 [Serpula lacrymans var. lacrymans S7.3]|uniref:Uncharacterized protein n=1 Tax=Serpula lacrymans var. lacrymans (strain S7.3) TaxID=936435 RepID=F8QDT7_SERL3|nr:hypothetical protein SERLA73DRAFT_189519 [Serpula lacrymans var. lacrymans S7.3]
MSLLQVKNNVGFRQRDYMRNVCDLRLVGPWGGVWKPTTVVLICGSLSTKDSKPERMMA